TVPAAGYRRGVYRFLLRPSWIALTLLLLLGIPVCVLLGQWQLSRYHQRHDYNQQLHHNLGAPAVPVGTLTSPDRDVPRRDGWRVVTAAGRYDPAHELLVRNRTQDGAPGFFVLTPLVGSDGAAVLVNRGW